MDAAALPATWTATEGSISSVSVLGDINGDGHVDALVEMNSDSYDAHSLLVLGPLTRTVVLPQDAASAMTDWPYEALPGDATGDGVPDFVWRDADRQAWLVAGPLSWPTEPAPLAMIPAGWDLADANGDGRLDLYGNGATGEEETPEWGKVVVWTGGHQTWGGPADLTLRFECRDGQDAPGDGFVAVVPDTDGDGVAEMVAAADSSGWSPPYACEKWLMPLGLAGEVHVETSGLGRPVAAVPIAVGDQDGDGTIDFQTPTSEIVSAPLQYGADGRVTGGTTLFSVHPSAIADRAGPLGLDLDGDQVEDFRGHADLADETQMATYWTGGPTGGILTGDPLQRLVYDNDRASLYVDSGVPYVVAWDGATVAIASLLPQ